MPRRPPTSVWKRKGSPEKGFHYIKVGGGRIVGRSVLARIEALAIPPAWRDVEISTDPNAAIQATGYDAAGRKQYIYHAREVQRRSVRKYRKLLKLASDLPRIREVTNLHLQGEGLNRDRVLATVVRLMSRAFFRVGSERYAVRNRTFGIATLEKRHLEIQGNTLIFTYSGKSSVDQRTVVADTPLVEIIRELLELPGKRLFRYRDLDGTVRNVTSRDVNSYFKEIAGDRYTSKDIRTWGGTVRAATILADIGPPANEREARKTVALVCKLVSAELGNTPSVCRSAYIHPVVLEEYLSGRTVAPLMRKESRSVEAEAPEYYPEEAALMRFLERWG